MVKRFNNMRREGDLLARLLFFTAICLIDMAVLYPILNVLAVSLSSYVGYSQNPTMIFPVDFSLEAYKAVLNNKLIWTGYKNTIIITLTGTSIGITATMLAAYSLSKKKLKGKSIIMLFILFTMFFSGGMIPGYFLMRGLKLIDTLPALFLPGCLSAYNLILAKNFMESIPESLIEAAEIDGASEPKILAKVVLPLSKPIISVIVLFLAVGYWNNYFSAILYTRSQENWTLQLVLREIIMQASILQNNSGGNLAEIGANAVPAIMLLILPTPKQAISPCFVRIVP